MATQSPEKARGRKGEGAPYPLTWSRGWGRPFFVCSDQSNPCSFWVWGDVQHVAKPKCRHGFPSVIRKVKKETVNKDRLFSCCAQEDSCNYFEWVPEAIKENDRREEQYPAETSYTIQNQTQNTNYFRSHTERRHLEFIIRSQRGPPVLLIL